MVNAVSNIVTPRSMSTIDLFIPCEEQTLDKGPLGAI